LAQWRFQLMEIASEIRAYRRRKHPFSPSMAPGEVLEVKVEHGETLLQAAHRTYPEKFGAAVLGEKGSPLQVEPWPTNFRSCFDYGVKYVCPFFAGCDHQDWNLVPVDAIRVDGRLKTLPPDAREWGAARLAELSNLTLNGASNQLVVLSATSVETWLRCRERYRKHYEVGLDLPSNEAADLGRDFHHVLARHYRRMITKEET